MTLSSAPSGVPSPSGALIVSPGHLSFMALSLAQAVSQEGVSVAIFGKQDVFSNWIAPDPGALILSDAGAVHHWFEHLGLETLELVFWDLKHVLTLTNPDKLIGEISSKISLGAMRVSFYPDGWVNEEGFFSSRSGRQRLANLGIPGDRYFRFFSDATPFETGLKVEVVPTHSLHWVSRGLGSHRVVRDAVAEDARQIDGPFLWVLPRPWGRGSLPQDTYINSKERFNEVLRLIAAEIEGSGVSFDSMVVSRDGRNRKQSWDISERLIGTRIINIGVPPSLPDVYQTAETLWETWNEQSAGPQNFCAGIVSLDSGAPVALAALGAPGPFFLGAPWGILRNFGANEGQIQWLAMRTSRILEKVKATLRSAGDEAAFEELDEGLVRVNRESRGNGRIYGG